MNQIPPISLTLRQIASWQLPELTFCEKGQTHAPVMLAGLPSLQRGSVWRPNQVELLWDSILRGFPIGSLVVTKKLQRQKTRSGAHVERKAGENSNLPWPDKDYTHHLLDGQQRANALALGFLDPFPASDRKRERLDTLLWLDLDPDSPVPVRGFHNSNSTRSHLLRVTTLAHPWGFKISETREPSRLEHHLAREAMNHFRHSHGSRPRPCDGWPIDAHVPIPLAWALSAAQRVYCDDTSIGAQPERSLWEFVLGRCKDFLGRNEVKESFKMPDPMHPWAERALHTLQRWYEDLEPGKEAPQQAMRLAQALARAVRAQIVALPIDPDVLLESSRQESATDTQNGQAQIANVEHLFQRLNGGGTDLSPEERAYSMIKAYWPGIEQTIQDIKPRPPETQVALLGTRLGLALAQENQSEKRAMPPQPSVSSLRQLATVKVEEDQQRRVQELNQIKAVFGLPDETLLSPSDPNTASSPTRGPSPPPITEALKRLDEWFLYDETAKPWGLPPVLRSRLASQAPEVFLFLLRLANRSGGKTPDEKILRKMLGLATAIHWFGLERERAVRWLWEVDPDKWLDGSAFLNETGQNLNLLSLIRGGNQEQGPTVARILTPEELANYIDETSFGLNGLKEWNWWDSLIVAYVKKSMPNASEKDQNKAIKDRWEGYDGYGAFIKILSAANYRGTNALLLMYAQREQMHKFFPDYDPQDADYWESHNVPWDFDHLLPQSVYSNLKVDHDFIKVCQEWGNTIANLHLYPFEENRSRQDDLLENILPKTSQDCEPFLQRLYLWDESKPLNERARHVPFSMDSDKIRSNKVGSDKRVQDFVLGTRARLLRLYTNWFETLGIGSIL